MRPAIKAAWVEALRSGKFSQGQYKLKLEAEPTPQYCCLGVLCEVAGLQFESKSCEGVGKNGKPFYFLKRQGKIDTDFASAFLPKSFRDEIGITAADCDMLVRMNDDERASFEEIADWIEEKL